MKQFQAGYIVDRLQDVFEKKSFEYFAFKELSSWCSYFTFQSKSKFEHQEIQYSSNIGVLINLIQRGAPTRPNKYVLDYIVERSELLKYDEQNENSIVIKYENLSPEEKELIFRSLHLIEPRLDITTSKGNYERSWENLGSAYEENFIYKALPDALGPKGESFVQLLATQRTIKSIAQGIEGLDKVSSKIKNNFEEQRTDFSIQFTYSFKENKKGIVIEIDGTQHNAGEQLFLDSERDRAVAEAGWHNTLRIKTSEFQSQNFINKISNILIPSVNNLYVKNCLRNFIQPLWDTERGKDIIQISLIPFAVARLQR